MKDETKPARPGSLEMPTLTCLRCGHSWIPRRQRPPVVCPGCKSPRWNMPYEKPRDQRRLS